MGWWSPKCLTLSWNSAKASNGKQQPITELACLSVTCLLPQLIKKGARCPCVNKTREADVGAGYSPKELFTWRATAANLLPPRWDGCLQQAGSVVFYIWSQKEKRMNAFHLIYHLYGGNCTEVIGQHWNNEGVIHFSVSGCSRGISSGKKNLESPRFGMSYLHFPLWISQQEPKPLIQCMKHDACTHRKPSQRKILLETPGLLCDLSTNISLRRWKGRQGHFNGLLYFGFQKASSALLGRKKMAGRPILFSMQCKHEPASMKWNWDRGSTQHFNIALRNRTMPFTKNLL